MTIEEAQQELETLTQKENNFAEVNQKIRAALMVGTELFSPDYTYFMFTSKYGLYGLFVKRPCSIESKQDFLEMGEGIMSTNHGKALEVKEKTKEFPGLSLSGHGESIRGLWQLQESGNPSKNRRVPMKSGRIRRNVLATH